MYTVEVDVPERLVCPKFSDSHFPVLSVLVTSGLLIAR